MHARPKQARDSSRNHTGFAGASTGEHQQRSLPVLDRRPLLWIQSQGSAGLARQMKPFKDSILMGASAERPKICCSGRRADPRIAGQDWKHGSGDRA
jgi:hypothetical protein